MYKPALLLREHIFNRIDTSHRINPAVKNRMKAVFLIGRKNSDPKLSGIISIKIFVREAIRFRQFNAESN